MRILMWLTMGFGTACVLFSYGWPRLSPILPTVFALLSALAGRKWRQLWKMTLVFLGCILGLSWCSFYSAHRLAPALQLNEKTETATIHITDRSYETGYGAGADGKITIGGRDYNVRLYLNGSWTLEPGDQVRGTFRFRTTTPGGADTYHAGMGIFLLAYQEGEVEILTDLPESWRDFPARLRSRILDILTACFPEDTAPFAKALLLGQTEDLSYEQDTAFQISGIRHVVAVSGLHVSILFALLSALSFHRRWLMTLVGLPALLLFAAVAGFTPSVNRSCMMWALMLLAQLVEKEYDGPTALAFAVLVMLLYNPLVITAVSFQLSVASVSGIFLFSASIYAWMQGRIQKKRKPKAKSLWVRWLSTSVSISLGAMVLTVPLCAWYFGTVSLIGVVTNLLTLWLISFIFYGIMGVCLLSLFWTTGAVVLAEAISLPIRFVLLTARVLARFPLAAVYTASPYVVAWLVFVYILLAIFLLMKKKKPGILFCCAVIGLCAALSASFLEPKLDDIRLTVLDVGQGQCLLVQTKGRAFMVDCGGDSDSRTADIAAETLLSQGITRLDGLILTHMDRDHAGAVKNLLTRIRTDLLIAPPVPGQEADLYASRDMRLTAEDLTVTIFTPQYPGTGNKTSLCVLFESEKCDILITGDRDSFGERMLLRKADLPPVDVLIAGHHGAADAACEELLRAVSPEIVCISVEADNPFGNPAPALLDRLRTFGCQIYRTDRDGTIIIRR